MQEIALLQQTSLLAYNTFGLPARAEYFAEAHTVEALRAALETGIKPVLLLGGGSNILFTKEEVPGLVLRNAIRGIEIVEQNEEETLVKAGGGEVWHDLVLWAVAHGLGGIENLSLIPGTVGAAPVQNIGAYGVELKDTFQSLEAVELASGALRTLSPEACRFGYRDSIFKREAKGKYAIVSVTFRLSNPGHHRLNTSYGDVRKTLEGWGIAEPTIADISRAVIHIRSSKLPDPAIIGNCGSFFKNPECARTVLDRIRQTHPAVPHYDLPEDRVKIPAGWLIEQCGWKGKRVGNTGCYEKQALVLVNLGGAKGKEVKELAEAIIESVDRRFGIRLEPEVNMLL